jgi:MFS family permease
LTGRSPLPRGEDTRWGSLRRRWQLYRQSAPRPSAFEGRDISRLMLFFAIVYAVEGIGQARVGIILQPLTNYLKTHGWTPLEVTAYFGVLNFPWVIKPVFGLISDFVPLFGYRRTSYLLLASAGTAVGYAGIALLDQPAEFALFLLLTSYAMATASTLCGALLAENGRTFQQSSLFVGQQWLWFYVAIMLSALVGGELVEHLSASMALKAAAGIAAVAPIAVMIATPLLLTEARGRASREAFRNTLHGTLAALKSRRLWLVAAFLFLYAFAPGFGTPLYYYMTDTLRFSQGYIGVLGGIASAGWIAGALLHRWLMRRMNPETLLYLSIVLGTLSAASFLLLTGEVTAAIVNFANGVASMIATIATLTLAAQHCPRRAEGFAFAGLMSVSNLADICSINVGAFLYERVFTGHLAPLIIVAAATTAIAAMLVPLLDLRSNPVDSTA